MRKFIIISIVALTTIAVFFVVKGQSNNLTRTEISPNLATVLEHTGDEIITSDGILYKNETLNNWAFRPGDSIRFIKADNLAEVIASLPANQEPLLGCSGYSGVIVKVEQTDDEICIKSKYYTLRDFRLKKGDYLIEFWYNGPNYLYLGKSNDLKAYLIPG